MIRRDLGPELIAQICIDVKKSIQYGLDHREEGMAYAIQFSRGLDVSQVDRFIGMYVNDLTLDYGPDGREAVARILSEAYEKKLIPKKVPLEFV